MTYDFFKFLSGSIFGIFTVLGVMMIVFEAVIYM